MERYVWQAQHSWHPGCGWLESPHPRDTWARAWEEGLAYAENAYKYHGQIVAIRVAPYKPK